MKISTQTRYATRLLLEVAVANKDNQIITIGEIAKKQNMSHQYIQNIACKLKKAGLLNSIQGNGGGFYLACDPEEISVGRVMRLMETTYFEVHCIGHPDTECVNYPNCILADIWVSVEDSINQIVDNIYLSDLLKKLQSPVQSVI